MPIEVIAEQTGPQVGGFYLMTYFPIFAAQLSDATCKSERKAVQNPIIWGEGMKFMSEFHMLNY